MRIVFLSYYSGLVDRGVETFVSALASRLSNHHEVLVIQGGKITSDTSFKQISIPQLKPDIKVNPVGVLRKLHLDFYSRHIGVFTIQALSHISSFKPDIIVPLNGGWQVLVMKMYCLYKQSKLVISGQAGLGWDERWNLMLNPDLFVALSKRNAAWAKTYISSQRIMVIPNGVDLKLFTNKGEKFSVDLERPRIVCVAGPERYKRVIETIHAVAQLPKASLLVVGGSEATRTLGRKLLGKRFAQMKISHDDMPSVYRVADLFTLVSETSEAFGIAYVEALAANLPVVAPKDQLRREIVGEAGLFVENPQDCVEYAHCISQGLLKKWGNVPSLQAKKYDWDIIASTYEKAFLKLLTAH